MTSRIERHTPLSQYADKMLEMSIDTTEGVGFE